jgi:hypothetical protein
MSSFGERESMLSSGVSHADQTKRLVGGFLEVQSRRTWLRRQEASSARGRREIVLG